MSNIWEKRRCLCSLIPYLSSQFTHTSFAFILSQIHENICFLHPILKRVIAIITH